MDDCDNADKEVENNIRNCIFLSTKLKDKDRIFPNGECHDCYEPVEGNKLFCNNKCASSYHKSSINK